MTIEYRWAEGHNDRLPALAADMVRRRVAVIVSPIAPRRSRPKRRRQLSRLSSSIGADPVKLGLVASLNRPGGNATGISDIGVQLGAKRLALLHELMPNAARFAALVNPDNPGITVPLSESQRPLQQSGGKLKSSPPARMGFRHGLCDACENASRGITHQSRSVVRDAAVCNFSR